MSSTDYTTIKRLPSRASGEELFSSPSSRLSKHLSIVVQDNRSVLGASQKKTEDALGRTYRVLQKGTGKFGEEMGEVLETFQEEEEDVESNVSVCGSEEKMSVDLKPTKKKEPPPLPRHTFSLETSMKRRGEVHLQSADLFDNFSPVQKERQLWAPPLPDVFLTGPTDLVEVDAAELIQRDPKELKDLHPNTFGRRCVEIQPCKESAIEAHSPRALRVGLILSGGPAPGGHNVIAGVYDYIKGQHSESQLFGFMGGLDGVLQKKYRLVSDDLMDRFRNQGGFDMLWSGRGRINGLSDLEKAHAICVELELQGLIMVGGDGSNSNAALLSEYFAVTLPTCAVIGVPKTIDGDLRSPWIETSFGFDTAAKTYSELIGNLCTDVTTAQQVYHFVRVMGRSASHLVLECAMQTRPNLVFIGEEVERNNVTLQAIVNECADLIFARRKKNRLYGIVLVPEGLIEFIPEIKVLIDEINKLIQNECCSDPSATEIGESLSPESQAVWKFLPESIQEQLLMDREATGYIQVSKIATERLLKLLTETELLKRGVDPDEIIYMTHYFGYEGRCAMPSNFDATYCYSLGYTAGALIDHKKNGYVSTVRHLDQHPSMWQPAGLPFTRIMEVKVAADGSTFPAVTRQLVDLDGPLFKVLCEVRDLWKHEDCYRVPGPIQFEGPIADISDHTVALPTSKDLLWGMRDEWIAPGRSNCPKRYGALSEFQKYRLQCRPEVPEICRDIHARAMPSSQYLPKDPFTQRQILLFYPHTCNSNQFHLQEIISDRNTPPIGGGLRVGVVFLSRQSPGIVNVLWGVHERLKSVGGRCIGFYGTGGLLEGRHLEIKDSDLEMYYNQGGMELLGKSQQHSLLLVENQEKTRITCEALLLDGLVIAGSSLAMTEAALTSEYFLAKGCRTSVIGIPATGSNNITHDLIEANIGFDTSSKLYASLIGNVLTDAASMPKYWHFVRLMGRQPSNEVLECALQTHPNVVIIAEEYGAANKTLWDVVNDIADVVCKRADLNKNFGSVLIPDGLLLHLPNMKALMNELSVLIEEANKVGEVRVLQKQLEEVESFDNSKSPSEVPSWVCRITPWSLALFKSLPKFIRRELTQVTMGEMLFTLIETELLLSQMVGKELQQRKKEGKFSGKFASVCHYFGYQGRSAMPSQFDSQLGLVYGHLAAICIESGLTAHCCTVFGLVGEVKDWKLAAIPFNSMFQFMVAQDEIHPDLKARQADMPIIPSAEVNLQGKAYRWMKSAVSQWQLQDRFCNPGPVQFDGKAASFYHRILHEEQAEYYRMLRHVQLYSQILKDTCNFGIDEHFLRVVFANLNAILALRFHSDNLMAFLQPLADVNQYEEWQQHQGQRPEVWQNEVARAGKIGLPFPRRPSIIGLLAGIRMSSQSRISDGALSLALAGTHVGSGNLVGTPGSTPSGLRSASISEGSSRMMSGAGGGAPIPHNVALKSSDSGWGSKISGVEAYPVSPSAQRQLTQPR